ncbi:MAG: glycosyltransferase family 4 protein [Acidobacteria bacterium]|nr:glycosyltransferase family 4 protein [Acidobacteriota bacterium]
MSNNETAVSSKPTLWVLTEVYYPEEISTGYYLTSIAEGLTDSFKVKVITGQPKHMSRGSRAPKRETRDGVEVFRVWGTTFDKNFLPLRLLNMATIGLSTLCKTLISFRSGDKVLVVTAPPTMPFIATLASLAKGAATTVLIQDSYPEILTAVGAIKPSSLSARLIDLVNRWVFKYSRMIIVMGRDMKALLERKTEGLDIPVRVIPNWADLENIHPVPRERNELLAELGLQDKFVLLCAGNIGPALDLCTIVNAAALFKDDGDIHFLFIGAGARVDWLRNEIENRGLTNVTVHDYIPRSKQTLFLNACDAGLVSLVRGMKGTAMPSRTYNLMAAAKPVVAICEKDSELELVVHEDHIGIAVEPGDAQALCNAILELKNRAGLSSEFAANGRRAAQAKYSLSHAIDQYREALI